jgi:uncharacterized SAM-dependent methyltransferase
MRLILGVDLKKDRATLEAAYNDAQGVTAAFNRNVLTRINRELGADFRPDDFRHVAFFDEERGRIEMHLESRIEQVVHVCGRQIVFRAGERIHTENSYKFSLQDVDDVCLRAGFRLVAHWTDDLHRFGVVYLTLST